MFETHNALPENYQKIAAIDMKNNRKEFRRINIMSILLLIPFIIGLMITEQNFTMDGVHIVTAIAGFALSIIIHELVHGIFFKMGRRADVRFQFHGFAASASAPGTYFKKGHYLMVGLAPAVLVNTLLVILMALLTGGFVFAVYFILAFHFAGCAGDFYVTWRLMKMPADTLIEDYGVGMRFYSKET